MNSELELANLLVITNMNQLFIRAVDRIIEIVINVLAEEANRPISEQELSPTAMNRTERTVKSGARG